MIQRYQDLKKKEKSRYSADKQIQKEKLVRISRGLYAPSSHFSVLEKLIAQHPHAIFTGLSAFYFWGMTNEIPDYYYVATHRDGAKIRDSEVIQKYVDGPLMEIGKTSLLFEGTQVPVYDQERLLIDLIRFRNQYPMTFYKEIIAYYRNHLTQIDLGKIEKYLLFFKHKEHIMEVIQREVF